MIGERNDVIMNRRTLLKTGSLALMGIGVGGCARRSAPTELAARRPRVNLAPVQVSWDRVIRTTVGLRPRRDSGFVLKAESFDAKTIIHNYGHGGAGMSLAWGTGLIAAEMALQHLDRRLAVIGCGSVGLSAARQAQRRGFDVTIYAMSVPPDTTSNMSMAGFTPVSGLIAPERRTPEWDAQFRRAAEISYRELQLLAGRDYGVYWIDGYSPSDNAGAQGGGGGGETGDLLPDHLRVNRHREVLGPGEHPFPSKYAIRAPQLSIEPSIYLDTLVRDFLRFGGRIVIRKFDTPRDLMALSEPVIVNCTGLGSKALFNDDELVPVKGQLTLLIPQAEVRYRIAGAGGMNPRNDGIVIGNLMERGNWSLEPDPDVRQRVVETAMQFFAKMAPAAPGAPLTRSTAPAVAPSLDSFFALES
jgi:glycine/D-amino acid oxidase-like deaminating enzyme